MITLWLVTGAALVVALAAYRRARRTAQKVDQLSQMYWELKYKYGELRQGAPPAAGAAPGAAPATAAPPGQGGRDSFVPLTSLKR